MANSVDARLGHWRDYSRAPLDQWQYLEDDFWLRWMTAFVAVSLTLISPSIFKIVRSSLYQVLPYLSWFEAKWRERRSKTSRGSSLNHEERRRLITPESPTTPGLQQSGSSQPHLQNSAHQPDSALNVGNQGSTSPETPGPAIQSQSAAINDSATHGDILRRSESSRIVVLRFIEELDKPSAATIVITTVLVGLCVAQAIAGAFSAKIASNRIGLSSSETCGIWQLDSEAGEEPIDRDKEARASEYARNCYNEPSTANTLSCKMFYNQSIAFNTYRDQRCPFHSPELCSEGLYSAVSFDTGLVDASVIGVNAASTHRFRRTTTCSPLNMSAPYITAFFNENDNSTNYRYYYGSKDDTNYTFDTSGNPFGWLIPAYSVNTYFSSLYHDLDYWHPIPELGRSPNSTLTIMFISSMHIYHTHRSDDPIFPAKSKRHFQSPPSHYFYNADPRARPLACVDTTSVCSPNGEHCWSMDSSTPSNSADSAYWLMKWSLENSDTYDAIKWRLGTALLAQERIAQSISSPLAPNHWELEASALFATSLAMIQYDAWGIATGEDRRRPGYVEITPNEARGRLCGLYKFQTEDFTNVNAAAFWGFLALAMVVFVLSWDWETLLFWGGGRWCCCCCWRGRERQERRRRAEDGAEEDAGLVIEVLLGGLWKGGKGFGRWIWGFMG